MDLTGILAFVTVLGERSPPHLYETKMESNTHTLIASQFADSEIKRIIIVSYEFIN